MCNRFGRHRRVISCWYAAVCSGGAVVGSELGPPFYFSLVEFIEVLKTVLHLRFNCSLSDNAIHIFQRSTLQMFYEGRFCSSNNIKVLLPLLLGMNLHYLHNKQRGPCHHDWLWKVKCSPVKGHKKLEQEGEIRPNDVIFNKLLGACEYLAFLLKGLPAWVRTLSLARVLSLFPTFHFITTWHNGLMLSQWERSSRLPGVPWGPTDRWAALRGRDMQEEVGVTDRWTIFNYPHYPVSHRSLEPTS